MPSFAFLLLCSLPISSSFITPLSSSSSSSLLSSFSKHFVFYDSSSSSPFYRRQQQRRFHRIKTFIEAVDIDEASSSSSLPSSVPLEEVAMKLQELLLNKEEIKKKKNENEIQNLIQQLSFPSPQQTKTTTYDPNQCLYGPLYCTLYSYYPNNEDEDPPLWEQISLKDDNIKGQQYNNIIIDEEGRNKTTVINYSEIWGKSFSIQAEGFCTPLVIDQSKSSSSKSDATDANNNNVDDTTDKSGKEKKLWNLSFLTKNPFSNNKNNNNKNNNPTTDYSSTLKACPDDYTATITKACFNIFGTQISLPIKGTGALRILYANPNLRIFYNLVDTDSTQGDWEKKGLVVVQVRSNLVVRDGEIDLRS